MWKKILLIIVVIAAVAGGTAYYLGFFEKEKPKQVSPAIDAIPANAAFIIEWKSLASFRDLDASENKIILSLKSSGLLDESFRNSSYIDSVLMKDSTVLQAFSNQPVFISAHLSGVKKFNFLFTTNLPDHIDSTHVERFFKERFKDHQLSSRLYEGSTVYELKQADLPVFSYTIVNSVFVGSRSTVLTEEGIRHIRHGKSVREDVNFKKVMETSKGRESGTIYINYKILPSFAELFVTSNANKEFKLTTHFANWTAADIKVKDDALLLSGYVFSNDTNNNYLNIYKTLKPQQIRFHDVIPSTVSYCHWIGIENAKTFFRNYFAWLENSNRYFHVQNELKAFNDLHRTKFPEDLSGFCGKEVFYFSSEKQPADSVTTGSYLAMEITDADRAMSYFKKIRPADKQDTLAITSNEVSITPLYLGTIFNLSGLTPIKIECNFVAVIGDYFVFAPTREDLLKLTGTITNGNTLKKSAIYSDLNEYLPNEASVFIFTVPFRSKQILPLVFDYKEQNQLEETARFLSDYSVLAMQITSGKDLFYQDFLLKYNPEAGKQQIPVWEADTEEDLAFVQAVPGADGVFAIDVRNKLFYYDAEGNLKFSRQLSSAPAGKISLLPVKADLPVFVIPLAAEIIAFNSNGIEQAGFPIKIKPAQIAVFDYEDKKDPRIFVGTTSGKVICYNGKGESVSTFSAPDVKGTLTAPPVFLRSGTKDYLCFTSSKQIVLTDRKGKTVYMHTTSGIKASTVKIIKKGGASLIGYLNESAQVVLVSPDKKSAEAQPNIQAAIDFYYEDLDKDRKKEFILADSGAIRITGDTGMVKQEIAISNLHGTELVRSGIGTLLKYSSGTEKGLLDPKGYPVSGLPVQATDITISASERPLTYYVIRAGKIYKFVTTGN